jgi:hypothetical protein
MDFGLHLGPCPVLWASPTHLQKCILLSGTPPQWTVHSLRAVSAFCARRRYELTAHPGDACVNEWMDG